MNSRIWIALIISLLLFSCGSERVFKETKLKSDELANLKIMGFGTGKAMSESMAKSKARTNATMNLMDQIKGRKFNYSKTNGSIAFNTTSKGKISNTEILETYDLGENNFLTIMTASVENRKFDKKNSYLLNTSFRTKNLLQMLTEKYQIAVQEVADRKYKKKTAINGKLYLTKITISDFEDKPDFAVDLQVLLVFDD